MISMFAANENYKKLQIVRLGIYQPAAQMLCVVFCASTKSKKSVFITRKVCQGRVVYEHSIISPICIFCVNTHRMIRRRRRYKTERNRTTLRARCYTITHFSFRFFFIVIIVVVEFSTLLYSFSWMSVRVRARARLFWQNIDG